MLASSLRQTAKEVLARRLLSDGGVADQVKGKFRVDATAWAILVLTALRDSPSLIDRCRARLQAEQGRDGRLAVSRENPDSFWPTALGILAWQGAPAFAEAHRQAVTFLLETTGVHYRSQPTEVAAHDAALKGWPWVANTHSWIEPTVLGVLALSAAGYGQHDRAQEALRMILDRQLPHGGWNYGNTFVFGRELRPMSESTGTALTGLAGHVERKVVARSLDYLQGQINAMQTPISLGWGLLGMAAWGVWPSNGLTLVERCLANQSRYGEYDTSSICLVLLGALAGDPEIRTLSPVVQ
ncbi:MAG TPA: hypothetical protein VJL88_07740 [Nitrospira sp.]|nr:hypothetical protein [Nitrospira sp.]